MISVVTHIVRIPFCKIQDFVTSLEQQQKRSRITDALLETTCKTNFIPQNIKL